MNQTNTPQPGEEAAGGNKNIVFIIIALVGIVAIALMFTAGGQNADAPTDEDGDTNGESIIENGEEGSEDEQDDQPTPTTEVPLSVYFVRVVDGQEQFVRVTRTIPQTPGVARASINQLLQGPTTEEVAEGLGTAIPAGTTLQDIRIEDGVAYVDFDATLGEGVAGSAMVMAIREQIERTLTQFPTVSSVEISIEGETEGILQP